MSLLLQSLFVLSAIVLGSRQGSLGMGAWGALGLLILVFGFHLPPANPPVTVMLMILSVVAASGALQAAGGLDYLVQVAERWLRKRPRWITFMAPLVAYVFTLVSGTGHVAYSLLPIIAETSRKTGIRPSKPLSISVIASQQAITASPISAATVALLELMSGHGIHLTHVLLISIPATLTGCLVGALAVHFFGGPDASPLEAMALTPASSTQNPSDPRAFRAVVLFLSAVLLIVTFGIFPSLRPWIGPSALKRPLEMAPLIQMIMLGSAGLICLVSRVPMSRIGGASVFLSGVQAVIAIFGIAWLGDTFFQGNLSLFQAGLENVVRNHPALFGGALFSLSILLFSQAATVRALMPLGLSLGLGAPLLLALFPAVNGYFFLPTYPTMLAAVEFDKTKSTHSGRYLVDHSFMLPGLISTATAIFIGYLLTKQFL